MTLQERPFEIQSGALRLEGLFHEGSRFGAVVLHPHPQYGGDMRNPVVGAVCAALAGCGGATLRFNFRGTGLSDDDGRGEAEDAHAACAALRRQLPDAPLILAGYSFGAMIGAAVSATEAPAAMVLVSPPLGFARIATPPAGIPVLIITGTDDAVSPVERLEAYASDHIRVVGVPGADHGWWGQVELLGSEVQRFAESALAAASHP